MKIVGKQNVDYISKKTQEPVKGVSLHCVGSRNNVEGEAVETIFVSLKCAMYDTVMKLPLGSEVSVSYNRWGSVDTVTPVK